MSTYQSSNRWVVLLRHAEANKNIENRHGGTGTNLTERGRQQAEQEAWWFNNSKILIDKGWYSNQVQVVETIDILRSVVPFPKAEHRYLLPFNLGKLAGLSLDEAKTIFPEEAHQMELWRKGLLEVQELGLPEGDDPLEFYQRGEQAFKDIQSTTDNILVVASRSLIILLISIFLGRTPTQGGGYVEIPMDPCDRFVFRGKNGVWSFEEGMSTGKIL